MPPDSPNPSRTTEELIQELRTHQAAMEALAITAMQQELAAGNTRAAARFNQFFRQTQFNLKSLNAAEAEVAKTRGSAAKELPPSGATARREGQQQEGGT